MPETRLILAERTERYKAICEMKVTELSCDDKFGYYHIVLSNPGDAALCSTFFEGNESFSNPGPDYPIESESLNINVKMSDGWHTSAQWRLRGHFNKYLQFNIDLTPDERECIAFKISTYASTIGYRLIDGAWFERR